MKVLKKLLLIFCVAFFLFISSCLLLAYFFGDKVKAYMTAELNKYLNTEISVGDVEFTIIRNFPNASLVFKNVTAKEAFPSKNENRDSLFHAENLSLVFNIRDLFTGNYTINTIIFSNGKIKMRVNSRGEDNYHFWKQPETPGSGGFRFGVSELTLENIEFLYDDRKSLFSTSAYASKVDLALRHDSSLTFIEGSLSTRLHTLQTDTLMLIRDQIFKSKIALEFRDKEFRILRSEQELGEASFTLHGSASPRNDATQLDLAFGTGTVSLQKLLTLLPKNILKDIMSYAPEGDVTLRGSVKGLLGKNISPLCQLSFSLAEGQIRKQGRSPALENIRLSGNFSNAGGKYLLTIDPVWGLLGNDTLSGSFTCTGFENPHIQAKAQGKLALEVLHSFLDLKNLSSLEGRASFSLSYSGHAKDLLLFRDSSLTGTIGIKSGLLVAGENKTEITGAQGLIKIKGSRLDAEDFSFQAGRSSLNISGTLYNFSSFFTSASGKPSFEGSVTASTIDIKQLGELFGGGSADTSSSPLFSANIKLKADKVSYSKFHASGLSGSLAYSDSNLYFSGLRLSTLNGRTELDGNLTWLRDDSLRITCSAGLENINIRQLFKVTDNFNQKSLTESNINGDLSGQVIFKATYDKSLDLDQKKLYAKARITLEKGELTDFEPVQALSKFTKLSELKNIKFATLKNEIEISNRHIIIPAMEIHSNALNLTASGIHTLDNQVEYRMKLLLSEVLGKKAKAQNTEFGEIEDDGSGRTMIPLLMKGDVRNPRFYYDKAAVAQKIRTDLKSEKETLKQLFREEFKWIKKPAPEAKAETMPAEERQEKKEVVAPEKKKLREKLKALTAPLKDEDQE